MKFFLWNSFLINFYKIYFYETHFDEIHIDKINTSLAAQGALAHRLQRRTMPNLGGS